MSGSVNRVILIGNLGRDPEVRNFSNGGMVCNLRIATSETWRDKQSGERKERTEWHSVAIFAEHAATFAEKYLRKGSKVYVEGRLETRKWQDKDGQDRYSTEVTIRPYGGVLQGLSGYGDDGDKGGEPPAQRDSGFTAGDYANATGGGSRRPPSRGKSPSRDLDDEIPFMLEAR